MTVAEYKQGIQILLDAFLTDPTTWDKFSEEYRERMMNNYTRFWATKDGKRFIEACKFYAENSTDKKMPTNGQLVHQYRQTAIEYTQEEKGEAAPMPDEFRKTVEGWKQEKPFDMNKVVDDDLPF